PMKPLAFPEATPDSPSGEIELTEAVLLFVQRARAVDPKFDIELENAIHVASICQRLDGLPLAIELAAAQVSNMKVQELASRMERLLPLLVDGPGDQPARLQTMTNSLRWGYELLSPEDRLIFRMLSVFRS